MSAFILAFVVALVGCQTAEQKSAQFDKVFKEGVELTNKGDLAAAIPFYQKAIRILPNDPKVADAYNNLGWSLQNTGDLQGAAAAYENALKFKPNYKLARNNLTNVQRQMAASQKAPDNQKVPDNQESPDKATE